jgi:glycosyltransferase involved in cell wall biosynthesis
MKVIHILHSLKFSGAEIMYVDAAPFFQEKGCELTVMATAEELGEYAPYFGGAGYQIIHQPMPTLKKYLNRIKFYGTVVKLLKKEKFDVVHIHSSGAMWGFAFCAWIANIKSIYTFHAVFPSRKFTYPYHCLIRWSAKFIFKCTFQTISDSVYDHELNYYHNQTTKVYNWYGNSRYFPAIEGEKSAIRKDLGISEETLVLISVGGCSSIKRHTEIIKALSIIVESTPNCIYLHLGKGCSELEEIELGNKLDLNAHIRFYGNQESVRKYLIAADIYLMTSVNEGISITTIEAMACNVPAILYNVQGLRDFNKYGDNSILIAEDFNVLARTVINIDDDLTIMANCAKEHVNQFYNLEQNAGQIYDLYL